MSPTPPTYVLIMLPIVQAVCGTNMAGGPSAAGTRLSLEIDDTVENEIDGTEA